MRKGVKIKIVKIESGFVSGYTDAGEMIKLTRSQRNVLSRYKSQTYIEDIHKAFGVLNGLLENDFTVIKDGEVVYCIHK